MAREIIDDDRDVVVVDRDREPQGTGFGWVILVILVILLVLWLLIGGIFNGGTSAPANNGTGSVDVNVQTPSGDTQ